MSRIKELLDQDYVAIDLMYTSTDHLVLGDDYRPDDEGIAHWQVDIVLRTDDGDADPKLHVPVGYCRVAIFDLLTGVDLFNAADSIGGDIFNCAEVMFRPGEGLRDDVIDAYGDAVLAESVILLDHMVLEPDARGHGIGPTAARAIVRRLAPHNALVAAFPQPDGWDDMDAATHKAALVKLESTWGGIGLTPFREGFWLAESETITGAAAAYEDAEE